MVAIRLRQGTSLEKIPNQFELIHRGSIRFDASDVLFSGKTRSEGLSDVVKLDLDKRELKNLFEAAVRLKFDDDDDVPGEYFGSPFLAQALSKMFRSLVAEAEGSGDQRALIHWQEWGDWDCHPREQDLVVRRAARWPLWDGWSFEQRADALRHCAAPFCLSEEQVRGLISAVDESRGVTRQAARQAHARRHVTDT
ncbi:hypothetical protein [Xylanimonas oleitrophica]|uniref:hypothetical protein n=1 Tax=Xylanimonas oleitrophica TaxID=2607479 RepID=UPI0011B7384A|nr:hypothetical protein [Xylanimonas oleitrophica]